MSGLHVRLRVGGEHYALPLDDVREVIPAPGVEPVPGAPAAALGIGALRGQPLPVFDLARLLGLARDDTGRHVVVVDLPEGRLGLAVDEVMGVEALAERGGSDHPALRGEALVGDALVGVLELDALLGPARQEAAA